MQFEPSSTGWARPISITAAGFGLSVVSLLLLSRFSDTQGGIEWWLFAPGFEIIKFGHADVIEPIIAILIDTAVYSFLIFLILAIVSRFRRK